jgi:hypothetical protein
MKLYKLTHHHYGPKSDSHDVLQWLLADTDEEVLEWLANGHIYGLDDEDDDDGDGDGDGTGIGYRSDIDVPAIQQRAAMLGIQLDTDDSLFVTSHGTYRQNVLLMRGNAYDDDFSDTYYGEHRYEWDEGQDVDHDTAVKLIALGVAELAKAAT